MKYVIYSASIFSDTVINITTNPSVDLALLKKTYDVNSLELLTPYTSITNINFIMESMNKGSSILEKHILRGKNKSQSLKTSLIKYALMRLGITPLKRKMIVREEVSLPDEHEVSVLHNIMKGRMVNRMELDYMIEKNNIFFTSSVDDMLQYLYLTGRLRINPALKLNKNALEFTCSTCGREISKRDLDNDINCPVCGSLLDEDMPLLGVPWDEANPVFTAVKFKDYREFTPAQDRAADELCTFLKSTKDGCLLWTVPGSENINITSRAIKDALYSGGRCGIVVPCERQGKDFLKTMQYAFKNRSSILYRDKNKSVSEDIVICTYSEMKSFYKAFDLLIIYEGPGYPKIDSRRIETVKRSLKDWGKYIYFTSTPDYDSYSRALKNELYLAPVPIRNNGRPVPEPRIIKYRVLTGSDIFIPDDVYDYLVWSVKDGAAVNILVPYLKYVDLLKHELLNDGRINPEWIQCSNPKIAVLPYNKVNNFFSQRENVVVFLADDSIFDEKAILEAVGIAGRDAFNDPGEVVLVGAYESNQMHNAKMMLRYINKLAWEMGYLK